MVSLVLKRIFQVKFADFILFNTPSITGILRTILKLRSVAYVDRLGMSVESSPVLGYTTMEIGMSLRTSTVTVSGAVLLRVVHARGRRTVNESRRIMCVEWDMAISTTLIHVLMTTKAPQSVRFLCLNATCRNCCCEMSHYLDSLIKHLFVRIW